MVHRIRRIAGLLGPAFVAAIAYVDPGNFAANISAGAKYGYALLWVLVLANAMAMLVQYLSAKVGIVTGKSLPQIIAENLSKKQRVMYWLQAELVAISTDLAEVIGGALALNILFNVPMLLGALITGAVSLGLLVIYNKRDLKVFERVIIAMLCIIPIGFFVGLFIAPPDPVGVLSGLIPHLENTDMILLATAMLGATVMPHVVYLHSALARDRHGKATTTGHLKSLLKATKVDVGAAMLIAGSVNIAMLLLAASALRGMPETNSLQAIFAALEQNVSILVAWLFGISLLAAGFASTAVGSQAGAVIMHDMLERKVSLLLRRAITIIPAVIIIGFGLDATLALILSQVALSFGIPFALAPLIFVTRSHTIMGKNRNPAWLTWLLAAIVLVISVLNLALIVLSVTS